MTGTDWETHCGRCGDEYPRERESRICERCEKQIQRKRLMDGVQCDRCNGHGRIYGTWCDLERAMNGRDKLCPVCDGSGRTAWTPDPKDVHPDLRAMVEQA